MQEDPFEATEKTKEEDGTVIFKQVDTSSNYTKAAEYVDRLKRDRAVSKGTIDYIEDYDKKRTKGLIQTVLEDFNEKAVLLSEEDLFIMESTLISYYYKILNNNRVGR